jgi:hypothetical protein
MTTDVLREIDVLGSSSPKSPEERIQYERLIQVDMRWGIHSSRRDQSLASVVVCKIHHYLIREPNASF